MTLKTYGSLFAGVGGIDLGLDSAGFECKFQVEIDPNCQQTLQYHWPKVIKLEDVTKVNGYDIPPVDIISFGSPCQDLSFAGKRAGLNGKRSGLLHEAVRIIKEMREKTNGEYPKWTIWENVVGALSSNRGADFGQVLYEMDEAGACFSEWAVLDAQYFGVPQRRRRVFVISCFDSAIAARSPEKILPVKESSSGNSEKSFQEEKQHSREVASCLRSGGEGGIPSSRGENLIVENDESTIGFSHTQGLDPQASTRAWPTLRSQGGGHAVNTEKTVRRLTPIECERLMGWPDNHTLYRADGKENSDNTRYKMCGNGVVSPVVNWIAKQIINI